MLVVPDGLVEADEAYGLYLQTEMVLTDLVNPTSTVVTILSPDGK